MEPRIKSVEDLGYEPFFETGRKNLGLDLFPVARIVAEYREAYRIKTVEGEYLARITGKQVFNAESRLDFPAVGDWVVISGSEENRAVIHAILPRKTVFKRRHGDKDRTGEKNGIQIIAANIDTAFIVESVGRDYNLNRLERYVSIAGAAGIQPAIVLNKIDLLSRAELNLKLSTIRERFCELPLIATSTRTEEGLGFLADSIEKGKTSCFLGSSGVGKSSLINALLGGDEIRTETVSSHSDRGKHTTTGRQMYFLKNGGIVIDNPGIREIGIAETPAGIDAGFSEIAGMAKQCRYPDCTHTHEPGCSVLSSIKDGRLDEGQYSNYIGLRKEAEHYEMSRRQQRDKDRQFGKFLRRSQNDLKKLGHKNF